MQQRDQYGTFASKTPAKTEMEAPWKIINIQRNQLSICLDTFESNCNTEEQAAGQNKLPWQLPLQLLLNLSEKTFTIPVSNM